ncbi:hypothetical protein AUJ14_05740 [Candidatus Micrarchaeota archaeon CG1_02_55_22]|nr:MAG: hypothetical protein AUJ14_05740 [Candidatus Micrarchaeota archaeon CG1_02_55_22]
MKNAQSRTGLYVLAFVAVALIAIALATADYASLGRGFLSNDKNASCVGIITLDGEITLEHAAFYDSAAQPQELERQLRAADENDDVGSVLLVINSPGGGAVASQEAFTAVRTAKKPIVAYLGEVAASGGYYVASAADRVVANPNTLTGSIGARATLLNYAGLLEKLGISMESIQHGDVKDMGAPYRNITTEERAILEAIINESGENFANDVRAARKGRLNEKLFEAQALDARVLSATQAQKIGLVDDVATRSDALRIAAAMGNVSYDGTPALCVLQEPPSGILALFSQLSTGFAQSLASELRPTGARLSYG